MMQKHVETSEADVANSGLGHGLQLRNQRRCRWLECEGPSWIAQIQEVRKTRGQSQRTQSSPTTPRGLTFAWQYMC